ncbi:MAG TPA: protein-disulfide reductase DsbD domain-containing protein, partial [Tepidisphaeraceae bacterium]|nr:protein-disulfide reductase DsbD domain-containing protein [Tepidisphaeraceae bacterium]
EEDRPASPQQIAAGVVSAKAEWMSDAELHLLLSILPGFHINAHEPLGEMPLIATNLTVEGAIAEIEYPPGELQGFAFASDAIRVYDGDVTILLRFTSPPLPDSRVRLNLSYQACDENACFPPVAKQIEIDVPSLH